MNLVDTQIPSNAPGIKAKEINKESMEIVFQMKAITNNFRALIKKKNWELEPINSFLFSVSLK
ncbi:MAG: hypothetical protein JJE21_06055, partial [Spirochaetaceae bacterium]|nr:hypothetical protein [Spirochaetaceae bacterium]